MSGFDGVDLRILKNVRAWAVAHHVDAIGSDDTVLDLDLAGAVKVES